MKLPANPYDLIVPQSPDFRQAGWEYEFGKYQFFYVVGCRPLMFKAGISDQSVVAKHPLDRTQSAGWVDQFPGFHWDESFAANQVWRAIRQKPQQFSKACLSVIAVMNAVEAHGTRSSFLKEHKSTSISHFIKIKPAVFYVPEFNNPTAHTKNDLLPLLAACRQRNVEFISQIAVNKGATYPTLRDFTSGYNKKFNLNTTVDILNRRSSSGNVADAEIVDESV